MYIRFLRIVSFSSSWRLNFGIQHDPGVDEQPVQDPAETQDACRVRRGSHELCLGRAATVVHGLRAQSRQCQESRPGIRNSQGNQRYFTLFIHLLFVRLLTSLSTNYIRNPDWIRGLTNRSLIYKAQKLYLQNVIRRQKAYRVSKLPTQGQL